MNIRQQDDCVNDCVEKRSDFQNSYFENAEVILEKCFLLSMDHLKMNVRFIKFDVNFSIEYSSGSLSRGLSNYEWTK